MNEDSLRFETKQVHSGEPRPLVEGAVTMPLFLSSTYEYYGKEDGELARYPRLGNTPNQKALEAKLAALEGGEAAQVASSGMAAISTTLLAVVEEGRHLLAQDSLYGGTHQFLHQSFPTLGRTASFFDPRDLAQLRLKLRPETKAIYVESVSNPLMKVPDLKAIAAFAKSHDLVAIIDNTFPSPWNFNPLAIGFDLVLHSATKYLNGHTDIVGGCVAGKASLVKRVRDLSTILGGTMDAHTCYMLNRGLKTLSVRVRWQNESARQVAEALEKHPRIVRVIYPGLPSHPDHAHARELFRGFGGMLAFEIGGDAEKTVRCLRRLKLAAVAPSLGGVETLVTRPVTTSHGYLSKEELDRLGIRDTLVRVSVGLEAPEDLIADFYQALEGA